MDKRCLSILVLLLLFTPVLGQEEDEQVEGLGTLGTVGGVTELLPMWDFWLEFSLRFWSGLADYTEALIGYELRFDEYLLYKIFGVSQQDFDSYCGVIQHEPTETDPWNLKREGIDEQFFINSILALFLLIAGITMGYSGVGKIVSIVVPMFMVIGAWLLLQVSGAYFPLALDAISIGLFFMVTFNLMMAGEERETAGYGSFIVVMIPLSILLIFSVSHLVSYVSALNLANVQFRGNYLTKEGLSGFVIIFDKMFSGSEEANLIAISVAIFFAGLFTAITGFILFILDLTRLGDHTRATQIIKEVNKLDKEWKKGKGQYESWRDTSKDKDKEPIQHHLPLLKHLNAKFRGMFNTEGEATEAAKGVTKYLEAKKGGIVSRTKARREMYKALGTSHMSELARRAGFRGIIFLILGITGIFVGLAPLGFVLPSMNMVAVYYLSMMLILVTFLTSVPHTDPMVFFEDKNARSTITQVMHTVGYDRKFNLMEMLQNMNNRMSQKSHDEEIARTMKEVSGRTLDLIENKQISEKMYPMLMDDYENMVKAPFYQILQVRDVMFWALLLLFIGGAMWFTLRYFPSMRFSFLGQGVMGIIPEMSDINEWLTDKTIGCMAMHINITALLLWASFIVAMLVFIVRRSSFILTLLLPESVYVVVNTVFGKKQLLSVVLKLFFALVVALTALERIDMFKVQKMFFYFQPFFAVAVTGAIMFISTLFYIFEAFTISTVGGFMNDLLGKLGSGLKAIFTEISLGRAGHVFGAICFTLALLILIPYELFGSLGAGYGWWMMIWSGISTAFVLITGGYTMRGSYRQIGKKSLVGTLFFVFAGFLCGYGTASDPSITGWTLIPIAIGYTLLGGGTSE